MVVTNVLPRSPLWSLCLTTYRHSPPVLCPQGDSTAQRITRICMVKSVSRPSYCTGSLLLWLKTLRFLKIFLQNVKYDLTSQIISQPQMHVSDNKPKFSKHHSQTKWWWNVFLAIYKCIFYSYSWIGYRNSHTYYLHIYHGHIMTSPVPALSRASLVDPA